MSAYGKVINAIVLVATVAAILLIAKRFLGVLWFLHVPKNFQEWIALMLTVMPAFAFIGSIRLAQGADIKHRNIFYAAVILGVSALLIEMLKYQSEPRFPSMFDELLVMLVLLIAGTSKSRLHRCAPKNPN